MTIRVVHRDAGQIPKPPAEWFVHVSKLCFRANWIRAAAASRPRAERAAILEMSVLDERIDSYGCAFPGCTRNRRGPLCMGHLQQAKRRGYRGMTPLTLPSRSAAARAERRRNLAAKRLPAALRTDEPCRRCGVADWSVSECRKHDRPEPTIVRKCMHCKRLQRNKAQLSLVAMTATGNMREVMA